MRSLPRKGARLRPPAACGRRGEPEPTALNVAQVGPAGESMMTLLMLFLAGKAGLRALSPLVIAIPLMVKHVPAVAAQIRERKLHLP